MIGRIVDVAEVVPKGSDIVNDFKGLTPNLWGIKGGKAPDGESKEIWTVPEVAAYLQMSPKHVYKLAKDGVIPSFKIGRDRRVRKTDLMRWMDEGGLDRIG